MVRKEARLVANNIFSDNKGRGSTTTSENSMSGVTYGLGELDESLPTILAVTKPTNNHVVVISGVLYGPFALPFVWSRPPKEIQLA